MVKRWALVGNDYEQFMETDDCGQYVLHSDYAALEARIAELEKDAARYRWLRDITGTTSSSTFSMPLAWIEGEVKGNDCISYDWIAGEVADRIIDEAMSREA